MRGIFHAAFEDTRAAFAEVFPVLFPGGTGSISAHRPRTTCSPRASRSRCGRWARRSSGSRCFSGGERSLAAVAFLIAIFKARPSPFYILDEVEAALDDANLGRLLECSRTSAIVPAHRDHPPEAHDGDRGRPLRRLDAPGRHLRRRRTARRVKAEQKAS